MCKWQEGDTLFVVARATFSAVVLNGRKRTAGESVPAVVWENWGAVVPFYTKPPLNSSLILESVFIPLRESLFYPLNVISWDGEWITRCFQGYYISHIFKSKRPPLCEFPTCRGKKKTPQDCNQETNVSYLMYRPSWLSSKTWLEWCLFKTQLSLIA